jgi:hypothetical protein
MQQIWLVCSTHISHPYDDRNNGPSRTLSILSARLEMKSYILPASISTPTSPMPGLYSIESMEQSYLEALEYSRGNRLPLILHTISQEERPFNLHDHTYLEHPPDIASEPVHSWIPMVVGIFL